METSGFKNYCRKITNDLASNLRYGEFVDAYVILVDKIYRNPKIFDGITGDIHNDIILKKELAKAFSSCIYTKEAKKVVNKLRGGTETSLELRDYLEQELEKYIQKDVFEITRVSRKRLKIMLKRLERYYNYTTSVTEMQKSMAPNINWQDGLDIINNSIHYARIRAQNAQRIALGMNEIDIQKYQDLQENEFLNEYRKFHNEDMEIADRIQVMYNNPRKIEMYIPKKESLFNRLVSLNMIKRIPIYILDKMGILSIIRKKKIQREFEEEGFIESKHQRIQPKVEPDMKKKEEKQKETTVKIVEHQNERLYYNKKETALGSGAIQETPKWQPHKARPIITIMD